MDDPKPGTTRDYVAHGGLHRIRLKRRTGGWDIEVGIGFEGKRRNEVTAVFKKLKDIEDLHFDLGRLIQDARAEQARQGWKPPEDRVQGDLERGAYLEG